MIRMEGFARLVLTDYMASAYMSITIGRMYKYNRIVHIHTNGK